MTFEYEAVSTDGGKQRFRGIVEAPSGEQAIFDLMKRKLYPVSLRQMSQSDLVVAGRLTNYKRIKNSLTPNMNVAIRRTTSSPAPTFRIASMWSWAGWGVALLVLLWLVLRGSL